MFSVRNVLEGFEERHGNCEGLHEDGFKGSHDGCEGMSVELGKILMESYQLV